MPDRPLPDLPAAPIDRVARPLARFMHVEAMSGIVLLACTAIALVAANSTLAEPYARLWEIRVRVGFGAFELDESLVHWVNDGLMTIFFFLIGLEIKREIVAGELSEARKLALPIAAAVGGAALPALLFVTMRAGTADARGWAVPMATDIAFVMGALALLGPRVPHGLKVLVMALAIVDDIFAVIVIAAVYTERIRMDWLAGALAGFALVFVLSRAGVRRTAVYAVVGAAIWLCTLESGIHPTVAGALLGLITPTSAWVARDLSREMLETAAARPGLGPKSAGTVAFAVRESVPPLDRFERALHPWVSFGIMPLFALANAAVPITTSKVADALPMAVAAGLVFGKPFGIVAASWLAVRVGLAQKPDDVPWRVLLAAGFLCGIGFTMAIFVASLAYSGESLIAAKTGVLVSSLAAAVIGAALLRAWLPRKE